MSTTMNRRAALKTERALEHHAKALAPIKRALQDALHFSGIMHRLVSVQGGVNSWRLELHDGRRFEVRARVHAKPPHIKLREYGSSTWILLTNERDAVRFVGSL